MTSKKENLWIKWVSELYVKNTDWWDYKPAQGCSWYWKKICDVKEAIKSKMSLSMIMNMPEYSVKHIFKLMTGEFEKIQWDKYVWNRLVSPKHRFFLLLIMIGRLHTTDYKETT